MIFLPGMEKRKVGVFGLGATGVAACEALVASGAEVYSWDEAEEAREKVANTRHDAIHPRDWPWRDMSSLILSPGVPLTHPKPHAIVRKARLERVEVVGDIELFARAMNAIPAEERPRVIAVTGSNGKSTTTALIGHILRETGRDVRVGGNIGEPALRLPGAKPGSTYVLELSSFQLDLTSSLRANAAVFTNLSPDHIDRHGSLEGYVAAKARIFRNQTAADVAVIGVDDDRGQAMCADLSARGPMQVVPVSSLGALGRGVFALKGKLFWSLHGKSGEAGDISEVAVLKGRHNWQNACAALAAVMSEGVAANVAVRAMERFPGLPHRLEIVARRNGVAYVNDSKATNADAASHALRAYDDIYWIAGGKPKEGGVESLRPLMTRVRAVYLIGEAAGLFESQLAGVVRCVPCGDLSTAVARASRDAEAGGVSGAAVLLSPACASYDQFRNFEERGEAFRALVQQLEKRGGAAA